VHYPALYPWHIGTSLKCIKLILGLGFGDYPADEFHVGRRDFPILPLVSFGVAVFPRIEMVLPAGAVEDFVALGHFEPLGDSLVRFHMLIIFI
jgi:hypothetical protein